MSTPLRLSGSNSRFLAVTNQNVNLRLCTYTDNGVAARRGALVSAAGLLLFLFWAGSQVPRQPSALQLSSAPAANAAVLLQSFSAERRMGFVTVTGDAACRSGRSLRDVEAVAELTDSAGNTLRRESALIGTSILRPGERASFQIVAPDATGVSGCRIRFQKLNGEPLD